MIDVTIGQYLPGDSVIHKADEDRESLKHQKVCRCWLGHREWEESQSPVWQ